MPNYQRIGTSQNLFDHAHRPIHTNSDSIIAPQMSDRFGVVWQFAFKFKSHRPFVNNLKDIKDTEGLFNGTKLLNYMKLSRIAKYSNRDN